MKLLWTFVAGAFLGAAVVGWWYKPGEKIEAPAAAERQADGSLVLERTATNPKAKPAHAIPKGGKAERKISVDVQPERADCPICTVDLTLVRMPDDTRRVIASSQTGTVLGGLDVPILPLNIWRDRPWAAGISRGTGEEAWGLWLDRDFGPVRFGAAANKIDENIHGGDKDRKYEARFKLGLRF